jgi:suppressor of G2 allele of SKP1
LQLYSVAIDLDDTNTEYLLNRAAAYLKMAQHSEVIMDAKSALELQPSLARAHFRLGQAHHGLNETSQALAALCKAAAYGEQHTACAKLLGECAAAEGVEAEGAVANAQAAIDAAATAAASPPAAAATAVTAAPPLKANRISHDFFQSAEYATVAVMIKKVQKEDVTIEYGPASLSINIKLHTGADYNLELDLCHTIVPEKCSHKVLGTKVEIKMKKRNGVQWKALEGNGSAGVEGGSVAMATADAAAVSKAPPDANKHKKWEMMAQQAEEDEKEEKKEGDAALNSLFQTIYKDATPETQRAMNKSFQESGGTVLSTNWSEIGAQKTEIKPPEGMEHKKY